MAEIPVTKKSGIPWWVWAILAAIVLLLLFLFLSPDEADTADVAADRDVVVTEADPGMITDLTTLEQGTAALAGRQVDVDGVRVASMAGDRGFTVTDGAGASVLVVLDEVVPGPDSGADGEVNVNEGQIVDIEGEVFEVIDGRVNGEPIEGLPTGAALFVYARTVEIEER